MNTEPTTEQLEAAVDAAVETLKFQLSKLGAAGRETRFMLDIMFPDENTRIRARYPTPRDEDLASPISKLLDDGIITHEILTILTGAEFHIIGDIAHTSSAYLLKIPGICREVVSALEDYLDKLNLETCYNGPVGPLERTALLKVDRIEQYIKGVSCDLPPGTRTVGDLAAATFEDFMRANPHAPIGNVTEDHRIICERLQMRGLIE